MDFGHLNDIRGVDFSLAEDDPANAGALTSRGEPRVWIGCPVWSNPAWVGRVYPPRTPARKFLSHYSSQFSAVELNATHYAVPEVRVVEQWRGETPEGFRFAPKFPQEISHHRALRDSLDLAVRFVETLSHLGDRLGPYLLQLPPHFGPDQAWALERFVLGLRERLPRSFVRLAVELRHPGWFRDRRLSADTRRLLESLRATSVITDVSGKRELSHSSLTVPRAFVRFVGNALDPTDFERIDAWIERGRLWFTQGLQELYFFVHQPDENLGPELLAYLANGLNARCGDLAGWKPLTPYEPQRRGEQMSLL